MNLDWEIRRIEKELVSVAAERSNLSSSYARDLQPLEQQFRLMEEKEHASYLRQQEAIEEALTRARATANSDHQAGLQKARKANEQRHAETSRKHDDYGVRLQGIDSAQLADLEWAESDLADAKRLAEKRYGEGVAESLREKERTVADVLGQSQCRIASLEKDKRAALDAISAEVGSAYDEAVARLKQAERDLNGRLNGLKTMEKEELQRAQTQVAGFKTQWATALTSASKGYAEVQNRANIVRYLAGKLRCHSGQRSAKVSGVGGDARSAIAMLQQYNAEAQAAVERISVLYEVNRWKLGDTLLLAILVLGSAAAAVGLAYLLRG